MAPSRPSPPSGPRSGRRRSGRSRCRDRGRPALSGRPRSRSPAIDRARGCSTPRSGRAGGRLGPGPGQVNTPPAGSDVGQPIEARPEPAAWSAEQRGSDAGVERTGGIDGVSSGPPPHAEASASQRPARGVGPVSSRGGDVGSRGNAHPRRNGPPRKTRAASPDHWQAVGGSGSSCGWVRPESAQGRAWLLGEGRRARRATLQVASPDAGLG